MTNEVRETGAAPVLDEIIQDVRKLIEMIKNLFKCKSNNGYK
jgi:hypothetical protein